MIAHLLCQSAAGGSRRVKTLTNCRQWARRVRPACKRVAGLINTAQFDKNSAASAPEPQLLNLVLLLQLTGEAGVPTLVHRPLYIRDASADLLA